MSRSVVVMSGGDAVSPFTTPDSACSHGIFISDAAWKLLRDPGFTPDTGMAWNDEVMESVHECLTSLDAESL